MSTDTETPSPAKRQADRMLVRMAEVRDDIRTGVDKEAPAASINTSVLYLARLEAEYLYGWRPWSMAIEHGLSEEEATEQTAKSIVRSFIISGADDTWSGNSNDVRRAAFDGKRAFLDAVGYAL